VVWHHVAELNLAEPTESLLAEGAVGRYKVLVEVWVETFATRTEQ
jgi:hypothetical protein